MILGTTSFISLQIKWLCLHYKVALASIWHHPTAVPEANTLGTVSHSIAPRICQNLKIQSGEKIDMLLWKLSVRSLSIWWKHFSFLVCIQAHLFHSNAGTNGSVWCWSSSTAELSLIHSPKGWAGKHMGLPTEKTQMLVQNHNCLANRAYTQFHLTFQEGKSHGSSVLSENKHLASVIQSDLLYMHALMAANIQLLSICSAHIMQQRKSKSSRHGKVLLPLGSDKEGKCFLLPRQVACVKDYTELILHKQKVAFRDSFKTHLFWSLTYILLV